MQALIQTITTTKPPKISLPISVGAIIKPRLEFSERRHPPYPSLRLVHVHALAFRKKWQQLTCKEQKACVKGGIRTK